MKKSKTLPKVIAIAMLVGITSCGEVQPTEKKTEIEVMAPEQIVQIPEAKKAYETYGERRVPLIQKYEDSINRNRKNLKEENPEKGKPFDVGRFVHYDYETIKQYLAYIEQEAEKANVEISTLRFYFSNYPDETFFPGTKDSIKHPRQNSILISPTYNDGKRDYLFYVAQGAKGPHAVPLNNSFGEIKGFSATENTQTKAHASLVPIIESTTVLPKYSLQGGTSLTMNRGTGVPPPKNQ